MMNCSIFGTRNTFGLIELTAHALNTMKVASIKKVLSFSPFFFNNFILFIILFEMVSLDFKFLQVLLVQSQLTSWDAKFSVAGSNERHLRFAGGMSLDYVSFIIYAFITRISLNSYSTNKKCTM